MPKPKNSSTSSAISCNPQHFIQIHQWMVEGATEIEIVESLAQNGLTHEEIRAAVDAVYTNFYELMNADPQTMLGWTLASAKCVYQKMFEIGDYSGSLKALKEIRAITDQMGNGAPSPVTTDNNKKSPRQILTGPDLSGII